MKGFLVIIILALLFAGGLSVYKNRNTPQAQKYTNITSDQLYEMLKSKDFYFINVHIPYEGEIEGTDAFIPYNKIAQNLDKLPEDKSTKIVLYCQSGRMSEIAAQELSDLGYTNVYNHLFGMHDWQSKGYPLWNKN